MEKIREKAAGIDIGAKKVFVSIEGQEVKCFLTFTEDLEKLRNYRRICRKGYKTLRRTTSCTET